MSKRTDFHDKNKPGIGFKLFIPIRFDLSLPTKVQQELRNKFKIKKHSDSSISNLFRIKLLAFFDVISENDLLKKNSQIRKKVREVKREIKDEMGLEDREFSKWALEQVEEVLKNDKKI